MSKLKTQSRDLPAKTNSNSIESKNECAQRLNRVKNKSLSLKSKQPKLSRKDNPVIENVTSKNKLPIKSVN
jgi:hypothetical protein